MSHKIKRTKKAKGTCAGCGKAGADHFETTHGKQGHACPACIDKAVGKPFWGVDGQLYDAGAALGEFCHKYLPFLGH